jgi:hypothetical protein
VTAPNRREPDDQPNAARHREVSVGEEAHRQDRLRRAQLDGDERERCGNGGRDESEHDGRAPGKGRAAEPGEQDDGAQRRSEQNRAGIIDRVAAPRRARRQHGGDHHHRQNAGRQIDEKNPAPAQLIDEKAADQRADDGRDAEHRAEKTLVTAALARRNEVADHGDGNDDEAAAAYAFERAKGDQLHHVLREAAQRGAHEKHRDRHLQHDLAAIEVAEFSIERARDRAGEQIGRDHPGEITQAAEIADHGRQRGRDHGLVERGEPQRQKQRAEYGADRCLVLVGGIFA